MNRQKMLAGEKVIASAEPVKRKIIKEKREIRLYELGLGGDVDIEQTIQTLRDLQDTEKKKGCFTVRIRAIEVGGYDDSEIEIELYTEKYETDADIAKREAAAAKRAEAKKRKEAELAKNLRDPEYQKSLIDRINRNVPRGKKAYC